MERVVAWTPSSDGKGSRSIEKAVRCVAWHVSIPSSSTVVIPTSDQSWAEGSKWCIVHWCTKCTGQKMTVYKVKVLTVFIPKNTHGLKTSVKCWVSHWYIIFNWLIKIGDGGVGYSGSDDRQPWRPLPFEKLVTGVRHKLQPDILCSCHLEDLLW